MSVLQDLEFHLGEHWIIDFEVNTGEDDDIDIAAGTLQWRLATATGSSVMLRTLGDGLTVVDPATGRCTLIVTPNHQSSASVASRTNYQWEFRVTTAGATTTVQARGALSVLPSLFSS